jgi:anthranilate phosphoribosyltransferase
MMSWDLILSSLESKTDLSSEQARWAMSEILQGKAENEKIKQFLMGLKNKGESAQEVKALVDQMYEYCAPIKIEERAVDTVGTGGDGANTINISTAAAIITNAAGARVVKHGNRAMSSKSGAADLLEALGIAVDLTGSEVEKTVHKIGIGFCFAPVFHPAMRYAAAARKELGVATIFNILGPLSNPAKPKAFSIGVAMAEVLLAQGKEGFVFHGDDGLDEVSIASTTTVLQVSNGKIEKNNFDPTELGITSAPISALAGGDAEFNAKKTRDIFNGKKGAMRDAVTLNAAFAIAAFKGDFHLPLQNQIANGFVLANQAIDSGAAMAVVNKWVALSNELASAR